MCVWVILSPCFSLSTQDRLSINQEDDSRAAKAEAKNNRKKMNLYILPHTTHDYVSNIRQNQHILMATISAKVYNSGE